MMLKTILLPLGLVLTLASSVVASQNAENLFNEKCAICHVKTKPADFSTLVAPPAMGVVRHVKMNYDNKGDAIKFITAYTLNPQRDKAVCTPNTIAKFGLMPSQKGNVTEAELQEIANWMYDNIKVPNKQNGQSCNSKKGCKSGNCQPKGNNQKANMTKNKKISPFLITSKGMPHFTKMVKQNWNNTNFNLSDEQKEKLLIVRKTTMMGIMDLKPQVLELEKKIKKLTMKGEKLEILYPMVEKLAHLKAEATKVHIDCIHNTKYILNKQQIKFLLQK